MNLFLLYGGTRDNRFDFMPANTSHSSQGLKHYGYNPLAESSRQCLSSINIVPQLQWFPENISTSLLDKKNSPSMLEFADLNKRIILRGRRFDFADLKSRFVDVVYDAFLKKIKPQASLMAEHSKKIFGFCQHQVLKIFARKKILDPHLKLRLYMRDCLRKRTPVSRKHMKGVVSAMIIKKKVKP